MLPRILALGLLIVLSVFRTPAYSQSLAAGEVTATPDYVLYDSFLFRVTWLETQADHRKAQGKDDSFMRSWIKRSAGLSSQEESLLKAIAADWRAKTSADLAAARLLVAAGAKASTSPQLQSLLNQRQQTVLDHIRQLQAALGSARYAALDGFVRQTVNVVGAATPVAAK